MPTAARMSIQAPNISGSILKGLQNDAKTKAASGRPQSRRVGRSAALGGGPLTW